MFRHTVKKHTATYNLWQTYTTQTSSLQYSWAVGGLGKGPGCTSLEKLVSLWLVVGSIVLEKTWSPQRDQRTRRGDPLALGPPMQKEESSERRSSGKCWPKCPWASLKAPRGFGKGPKKAPRKAHWSNPRTIGECELGGIFLLCCQALQGGQGGPWGHRQRWPSQVPGRWSWPQGVWKSPRIWKSPRAARIWKSPTKWIWKSPRARIWKSPTAPRIWKSPTAPRIWKSPMVAEARGLHGFEVSAEGLEKPLGEIVDKPLVIVDWHYTLVQDDQAVGQRDLDALELLLGKADVLILSYVGSKKRAAEVPVQVRELVPFHAQLAGIECCWKKCGDVAKPTSHGTTWQKQSLMTAGKSARNVKDGGFQSIPSMHHTRIIAGVVGALEILLRLWTNGLLIRQQSCDQTIGPQRFGKASPQQKAPVDLEKSTQVPCSWFGKVNPAAAVDLEKSTHAPVDLEKSTQVPCSWFGKVN